MDICVDVWQIIINLLDIKSQLALSSISRFFFQNLKILKLKDCSINPEILCTIRFQCLNCLDVYNNDLLQEHVNGLNLVSFSCRSKYIVDINHMTRLKKFKKYFGCNINEYGHARLNIKFVHCCFYKKMKTCKINSDECEQFKFKLFKQNIPKNHLTDVHHMRHLYDIYSLYRCIS